MPPCYSLAMAVTAVSHYTTCHLAIAWQRLLLQSPITPHATLLQLGNGCYCSLPLHHMPPCYSLAKAVTAVSHYTTCHLATAWQWLLLQSPITPHATLLQLGNGCYCSLPLHHMPPCYSLAKAVTAVSHYTTCHLATAWQWLLLQSPITPHATLLQLGNGCYCSLPLHHMPPCYSLAMAVTAVSHYTTCHLAIAWQRLLLQSPITPHATLLQLGKGCYCSLPLHHMPPCYSLAKAVTAVSHYTTCHLATAWQRLLLQSAITPHATLLQLGKGCYCSLPLHHMPPCYSLAKAVTAVSHYTTCHLATAWQRLLLQSPITRHATLLQLGKGCYCSLPLQHMPPCYSLAKAVTAVSHYTTCHLATAWQWLLLQSPITPHATLLQLGNGCYCSLPL